MAEDLGRNLDQLTAAIKEQNAELKQKDSISELDKSIKALEKSDSANAAQLRQTLGDVTNALSSAQSQEQLDLAREQLEVLKDTTSTEEENRESAKRQEESNELLSRMVSGIDGLADSYDKMLDNIKPSAGLLAGLGAAALLFMDPETLFAGIKSAIDGVFAIVDSIKMFLEGDFTEGFALLGDNIGAVAGILGTLGILFGGTIIRAFGGIFKGIQLVIRGVQLFRLFMLGTFVPGMIGFFSTISAAVAPILIAAAPFIAIGALVAAGVYAIYEAFKTAKEVFNETGSITETMVTFATDIVTAPIRWIKNLSAWVLSKLGFEELATKLNNFDITKTITDTVMGTIEWIKELFTDPKAALTKLWTALVGEGGLVDMIFAPIDKAIAWVQGLFNWGDPELPFDIRGFVKLKAQAAIDWVKGLFTWASDIATEGWTNLSDFVSSKWQAVKTWFTGLFSWASDGLSEGWTNLTDFVKGKWTATKTWFTGLFDWSSPEGEGNVIQDLFNSAIEKVKTFFAELFDFLPSIDEIKALMTSLLPDWMQPDSVQEQRQSIEAEIANQQAEIADGDNRNWRGKLRSEIIEELQAELASLPQLNTGGIVSAPSSGTPVMLHGEEIVTPLNSPQGQVLMAINELMNAKADAGAGEYGGMGPMIVNGGSQGPSNSNNNTNISNSSYTIQQGITPDDFLKRDFLNFSY